MKRWLAKALERYETIVVKGAPVFFEVAERTLISGALAVFAIQSGSLWAAIPVLVAQFFLVSDLALKLAASSRRTATRAVAAVMTALFLTWLGYMIVNGLLEIARKRAELQQLDEKIRQLQRPVIRALEPTPTTGR